jgi:hypothetical protein
MHNGYWLMTMVFAAARPLLVSLLSAIIPVLSA